MFVFLYEIFSVGKKFYVKVVLVKFLFKEVKNVFNNVGFWYRNLFIIYVIYIFCFLVFFVFRN